MFFYTQSKNYPFEFLRISHAFTPKISKCDSGVVFPCGLCYDNDNLMISYGESDNQNVIISIPIINVDNMLHDIKKLKTSEYYFENYNLFTVK